MMSNRWLGTEYFWIWTLALLFIVAGSIFRIYRNKRLRIFCNPALSGASFRWHQSGVMILLLALGVLSTAAIIPASARKANQNEDPQPTIGILFDSDSVRTAALMSQDSSYGLQDSIQWVIENAPEEKISVWQTGTPVELLIPSTWDARAIQMLAAVVFAAHQESKSHGVPEGVSRMLLAMRGSRSRIVVLSARTDQEIESLTQSMADTENKVVFVQTQGNPISVPKFYYQNAAGRWVWESAAGRFREVLQSEQQAGNGMNSWLESLSVVRTLAILAFVFLSAETIWHLSVFRN
jgi:hypothetical protein